MMALGSVGPVLLAGLVAGILAGLVQSLFQVHDQIAGFVPRVVVMVMVLFLALPWMSDRLVDFSREYFSRPMLMQGPAAGTDSWRPGAHSPETGPGEESREQRPVRTASESGHVAWPGN